MLERQKGREERERLREREERESESKGERNRKSNRRRKRKEKEKKESEGHTSRRNEQVCKLLRVERLSSVVDEIRSPGRRPGVRRRRLQLKYNQTNVDVVNMIERVKHLCTVSVIGHRIICQ